MSSGRARPAPAPRSDLSSVSLISATFGLAAGDFAAPCGGAAFGDCGDCGVCPRAAREPEAARGARSAPASSKAFNIYSRPSL